MLAFLSFFFWNKYSVHTELFLLIKSMQQRQKDGRKVLDNCVQRSRNELKIVSCFQAKMKVKLEKMTPPYLSLN